MHMGFPQAVFPAADLYEIDLKLLTIGFLKTFNECHVKYSSSLLAFSGTIY
jgi:hypothetical protein